MMLFKVVSTKAEVVVELCMFGALATVVWTATIAISMDLSTIEGRLLLGKARKNTEKEQTRSLKLRNADHCGAEQSRPTVARRIILKSVLRNWLLLLRLALIGMRAAEFLECTLQLSAIRVAMTGEEQAEQLH